MVVRSHNMMINVQEDEVGEVKFEVGVGGEAKVKVDKGW